MDFVPPLPFSKIGVLLRRDVDVARLTWWLERIRKAGFDVLDHEADRLGLGPAED